MRRPMEFYEAGGCSAAWATFAKQTPNGPELFLFLFLFSLWTSSESGRHRLLTWINRLGRSIRFDSSGAAGKMDT